MAANTAYLLVPTTELPIAVWDIQTASSARRNTIGIRMSVDGTTAIDNLEIGPEWLADNEEHGNAAGIDVWYTLSGMKLDTPPAKPGLYIRNGKKIIVQ